VRAAILGFGCRLNASETEAMTAALVRAGVGVASVDDADVVVVNGCTITHAADRDAAAAVRRIHRRNPAAKVVVAGCYGASSSREAAALPGVALVVGNAEKPDIVDIVARAAAHVGAPDVSVARLTRGAPLRVLPPAADARSRALLEVQDGCDYRCSFCIVPSVRGPSRSLAEHDVVARAHDLVSTGVAEIVLTGIHLGTWGRDLGRGRGIAGLVRAILPVLGDARLRLSSIDPHEVDDALLELVASEPVRICRHLHLPVQSCDDGVLARMRRAHRTAGFVELVQRAAARVPGIAISTDVIAGHPGEDATAHARTRDTLASLPLAYMHVFPYSVRRGTAAATMDEHVAPAVITARAAELRAVSAAHESTFRAAQRGRELDVVVHRRPDARGVWWAVSDHDVAIAVRHRDVAMFAARRVRARVDDDGEHAEILA
jgi:threonylcarbamoyladenosine tRNA methylthiotransferase MtaB